MTLKLRTSTALITTLCTVVCTVVCIVVWHFLFHSTLLAYSQSSEHVVETSNQTELDNSNIVPGYKASPEVLLEGISPDWVKSLIMAEFRIETSTEQGTFESAAQVLDHYQEMGINGLWINPIFERGSKGNGYLSFGPHTIEPLLTGCNDLEDSYRSVRAFVDQAHRRNIRVFWDVVVWGTAKNSPLLKEHPEFYRKDERGYVEVWGGYAFDWSNQQLREWYKDQAVQLIEKTGADGFRVDLAPDTSGYFFAEVREELLKRGHKIAVISEMNSKRENTFDFEQVGVHGWTEEPDYHTPGVREKQSKRFGKHNEFLLNSNIVDVIRTGKGIGKAELQNQDAGGKYRFYTSNLLHHDDHAPFVKGSRLKIGYTALFAPFIPMWWIGEEWNNPYERLSNSDGVMFFNRINWESKRIPENARFFEDVKKMIRIRRSYPEIFEHFPDELRKTNITAVKSYVDGNSNPLQAYARFDSDKCLVIVPNSNIEATKRIQVEPELPFMGLGSGRKYQVVDLFSPTESSPAPKVLVDDYSVESPIISIEVPGDSLAILLIH